MSEAEMELLRDKWRETQLNTVNSPKTVVLTQRGELAEMEERAVAVELRVMREEGKPAMIEGHAAVFDAWSVDLGGFRERLRAGAFGEALLKSDARGLFNHDPNYVLGRQSARTLELWEDEQGLGFRVIPPETSWARDLLVSVERGDIREGSFSFIVGEDSWQIVGEELRREVLSVRDLYDVSIVTYPAYPQTSAQVRARVREIRQQAEELPQPGGGAGAKLGLMKRRLNLMLRR
jgi:hypothetical protein